MAETSRTLPGDPILIRLLEAARLTEEQVIYDHYGFDKTYAQLLGDILATRDRLRLDLPASLLTPDGLIDEKRPYVAALTNGGYEFIVAFFAIRALGGACFPFSAAILKKEAHHYLHDAQAIAILSGQSNTPQAREITEYMESSKMPCVEVITSSSPVNIISVTINKTCMLDPQGPGVVMCTYDTSGIPKAAILPRQCLVQTQSPALGKATLSYRPPHWRGGFASAILPLLSGHKLYSLKQKDSADLVWETLRQHRITLLIFNPVLLRRMKEVYDNRLIHLDEPVRDEYIEGFRNIGSIRCSGAFLSPPLVEFYTELTGLPFKNAYGQTECGGTVTEVDVKQTKHAQFSAGIVVTDHPVEVKLSEGTRGEFLVKTPWMMKGYINNPSATAAAFDKEGYLKTADIGHIEDGEFVFEGRANDDFIGRVPRIPVQFAINNLPYVAEAHVLSVPDYEERAVCGVLIRLEPGAIAPQDVTIDRLHQDISSALPVYMRPYLLCVLSNDQSESVPYTDSHMPDVAAILEKFFCIDGFWQPEHPTPGVQVWHTRLSIHSEPSASGHKPWDFASW